MIQLSNGHSFTFMAASGALSFDGRGWPWEWPLRWAGLLDPRLFTIVTKTLTRYPRRGNLRWYHPLGSVRPLPGGSVNAVGLTNPGIEAWCRGVAPRLRKRGVRLILSVEATSEEDLPTLVGLAHHNRDLLLGVELNCSCPNTFLNGERSTEQTLRVIESAKKATSLPLIVKLGVTHDYLVLAQRLKGTVEAISINSVPWSIVFPQKRSPLEHLGGGGVSGKLAQPWTWEMAGRLAREALIPVIGPSVWDYEDIDRLLGLGVHAVSFGSLFLFHPWRPTHYVRRWLKERGSTT